MIATIGVILPIILSFIVGVLLFPFWIRKTKQIGLSWEDMNKLNSKKVAGSGGVIVLMSFVLGVLTYIAYRVFYLDNANNLLEVFAIMTLVLLCGGFGLVDDLLGWRKGGLSKRSRIVLVALASISLISINAGKDQIALPIVGLINLGWLYPLVLIPIGVVGATTTFNFLAGFNGLESGLGIIILSSLSLVAYITGNPWLSVVGLCMVSALVSFILFNFEPAKVFPGDSLSYPVGALIAAMSIVGNFEKIAVIIFIPVIMEFFLKMRGGFVKQSFGRPLEDGSLELRYDKLYSLNHLGIYLMGRAKIKPTERRVVYFVWSLQIICVLIAFFAFKII